MKKVLLASQEFTGPPSGSGKHEENPVGAIDVPQTHHWLAQKEARRTQLATQNPQQLQLAQEQTTKAPLEQAEARHIPQRVVEL